MPMKSLCLAVAVAACAHASAAPNARLVPGDHDLALSHDGRERHYLVHVPPQAAKGAALPVILNFHGGGGNADEHRRWADMAPLADREGILVVFPDGTGPELRGRKLHTWNAGACCGSAAKQGVDDVAFTLAVLSDLARRAPVDRTRVYATGMSNGSAMAQRLAHDAPARIAAIATVSGANALGDAPLVPPVPLMHIHSVDDPRALYAGGLGPPFPGTQMRVQHPAVEATVRAWAKADGCAAEPAVGETLHGKPGAPDAAHTATRLTWSSCQGGSEVVLWRLTGSGHVWPGAPQHLPVKLAGEPTTVIDANEEMWAFFRRFARPDAPAL
jgi:polyhydroxybutyrate depolymerase